MIAAAFSKRSKNAVSRGMILNMAVLPTSQGFDHSNDARHCMADRDGCKSPAGEGLLGVPKNAGDVPKVAAALRGDRREASAAAQPTLRHEISAARCAIIIV